MDDGEEMRKGFRDWFLQVILPIVFIFLLPYLIPRCFS